MRENLANAHALEPGECHCWYCFVRKNEGRRRVNLYPGTPFRADFNELFFVSIALALTEISVDCDLADHRRVFLCLSADHLDEFGLNPDNHRAHGRCVALVLGFI